MHGGSIIKCLDKQVPTVLNQLFHQSHNLRNKSPVIKSHSPLLSFQNHFTNILNSMLIKQILWDPHSEVKQFMKDNLCGRKVATEILSNILNINKTRAKSILIKYPVFGDVPKKTMVHNFEKLKCAGVSLPLLQEHVILLAENSDKLEQKINILQNFVDNMDQGVVFLYHDKNNLDHFRISYENQIRLFQEQLQIRTQELYGLFSKYLYYLAYHPEETLLKLKLFLDHGITVNTLINYNWPMHHNHEYIRSRLKDCGRIGLSMRSPKVLNLDEEQFKRIIKANKKNELKLQENFNLIDLLSEKSGYSKNLIRYRLSNLNKNSLNFSTAKNIINTILTEKYDFHDIIWSIEVLTLPINLIIDRFSALSAINHKAPFLDILLLSDEAFIEYVNSKK